MITFYEFSKRVSKYDTSVLQEVGNRDFAMRYFICYWHTQIKRLERNGIDVIPNDE